MKLSYLAITATTLVASVTAGFFSEIVDNMSDSMPEITDWANNMDESLDSLTEDSYAVWTDLSNQVVDTAEQVNQNVNELTGNVQDYLNISPEEEADLRMILGDELYDRPALLGGLPIKNMTCITRHCSGWAASCSTDKQCRDSFACSGACDPANSTCTYMCSESYTSKNYDGLMHCMFEEHQCLTLPPPAPVDNATCRDPAAHAIEYEQSQIEGTWFVNYGFNPDYDCFDCQELSFFFNGTSESPIWYGAHYDMLAVTNQMIWIDVAMTGEESSKGIISLVGQDKGFSNYQDWYVMYLSDDTLMAYYCGHLFDPAWRFEGVLTMSRTGTLNQDEMPAIQNVLNILDIQMSDLCALDPADKCPSTQSLFLQ